MKHRSQISPLSFSDILFLVVMSRLHCLGGKFSQIFLPCRWYLRVVLGEIFPPWQMIVFGDRLWWLLSNLAPSPMIVRKSLSGWVVNFHRALVMCLPKVLTPPGPMAVDSISLWWLSWKWACKWNLKIHEVFLSKLSEFYSINLLIPAKI